MFIKGRAVLGTNGKLPKSHWNIRTGVYVTLSDEKKRWRYDLKLDFSHCKCELKCKVQPNALFIKLKPNLNYNPSLIIPTLLRPAYWTIEPMHRDWRRVQIALRLPSAVSWARFSLRYFAAAGEKFRQIYFSTFYPSRWKCSTSV